MTLHNNKNEPLVLDTMALPYGYSLEPHVPAKSIHGHGNITELSLRFVLS